MVLKLLSSVPFLDSSFMLTLCSCRAREDAFSVTSRLRVIDWVTDWLCSLAVARPKFVVMETGPYDAERLAPKFSAVECFASFVVDMEASVFSATPRSL